MRPRTPLLPWQGSSTGEGAESSSAARLTIYFFCSPDEWEERRGGPRAGLRLAGTVGWARRGRKEEGESKEGRKKKRHVTFRKDFHTASQPVTTQELLETTTRAEAMAVAPSPSPSPPLPGSSSPAPARPSSDPARQHLSRQRSL